MDKSNEPRLQFAEIAECVYLARSLGALGQKEAMTCDCAEQWDPKTERNLACSEHSSCINRATSVECVEPCLCGSDCENKRFQKRQYARVRVEKTGKKGFGLVAAQPIDEGQFIYEYVGEVIDEKTFRKRMLDYDLRNLKHFYFMMLTKNAFIDATEKGSLARFCNHSCAPNAYIDKWVVGDKLRMGIFAKSKISEGTEITFDYNVDRYGAQKQPCYCGAPNCLGWMGGKTQTDAALLLPENLSEALGVTRAQEKAWLKTHKKKSDAAVNEDFVRSLEVEPLEEEDVTKAMSALLKLEEPCVAEKLVERLYLTEDPKTNSQIVRMHGYKTLSQTLQRVSGDVVVQILTILKRWPQMTRNKIELLQIEQVVKELLLDENERVRALAAELLQEWLQLEMAYRIPKVENPQADLLWGRNERLQLPLPISDDEELPSGWQRAADPKTGTTYYYHTGLGVSRWDRPEREEPKRKRKRTFDDFSKHEQLLQQQREEQYNEMREKERMLQELIVSSQREVEEKKRLDEQKRLEKKQRREARKTDSVEAQWTRLLARYVPNMIKKHEQEIGKDNFKGCARELVKTLAAKEAKKLASVPKELEKGKEKKVREFAKLFMEKFLVKYRNKHHP